MKKEYLLKIGNMYLQYVTTNSKNPKNNFIESMYLTDKNDRCTSYDEDNAKELVKVLYIVLGIKFELKEVVICEDEED